MLLSSSLVNERPKYTPEAIYLSTKMALRRRAYDIFTKRSIPSLFKRYGVDLDVAKYTAAAHVFPMRVNNHISEDLIDW